jgi:hypothetical protein
MEAKSFIEPILEKRGQVIMTSLDVKRAFDSAWWPGILQGLETSAAQDTCTNSVRDSSTTEQ